MLFINFLGFSPTDYLGSTLHCIVYMTCVVFFAAEKIQSIFFTFYLLIHKKPPDDRDNLRYRLLK